MSLNASTSTSLSTLKVASLLATLVLSGSVLAQAAAPSAAASAAVAKKPAAAVPASSPAKKELIAKILKIQAASMDGLAHGLVGQPLNTLMQQAAQAMQQVPAEKREATSKAIEASVKKFVDENAKLVKERADKLLPSTVGPILEERFSEDELKQLLAWQESPVSKKFAQAAPDIQKALVEKIMAESGPTLQSHLQALQQDIVKQLGLQAPAASASGASKK